MDYIVEVKRWASHYWATVKGENPKSCHGGSQYNAPESRGKHTCDRGHEIPAQVRWEVESAWTEERYARWAARSFGGPGPCQFVTEKAALDTAVQRFLGTLPSQWWEEKVTPGEPGDKLWAGWVPMGEEGKKLVQENWGTLIAEVPLRSEGECGLPGACTKHGHYACDKTEAVEDSGNAPDPSGQQLEPSAQ